MLLEKNIYPFMNDEDVDGGWSSDDTDLPEEDAEDEEEIDVEGDEEEPEVPEEETGGENDSF